MKNDAILVLGAYGLAGRTVLAGLLERTSMPIVAAGRNAARLESLAATMTDGRVKTLTLDVADPIALRKALEGARLVVNAVGPYATFGAAIAGAAVDAGCDYLDCANEQVHFQCLRALDAEARRKGLLLVTGAGTIPGVSTLMAAALLENFPGADRIEIVFAQHLHAYDDSGFGSIMSGILDAGHAPVALIDGRKRKIRLGQSTRRQTLPAPFGRLRLFELPTIDALTLPERYGLRTLRTWFYLGEQPTWLFGLIRLLAPHRRPWAYRLIESVARPMNEKEQQAATRRGLPAEAMLCVTAGRGTAVRALTVMMKDGAAAMAVLPAMIVQDRLMGSTTLAGLATPLDLTNFEHLRTHAGEAFLRVVPD